MIITNNLAASTVSAVKAEDRITAQPLQPQETNRKAAPAVDDASGLEKIRAQIKAYDMAVNNAQDGISMLKVADDALGDTDRLLHDMRELAQKAANDSLTAHDRTQIQKEIDSIREQINHISDNTKFNAKILLNGNSGALWSSDDSKIKVRVKGGLLTIDEEGRTINSDSNYRLEIRSDPGKAQVQKSSVMSVTETMIVDGDIEVYYNKALWEIEQFYDSEGEFFVDEPQKLTLIQGDGKTASITICSEDTLQETAEKINTAIADGLGQKAYADDAYQFAVIPNGTSEVFSRSEIYDDEGSLTGYDIKSALVIRSAVQGSEGDIYFAGNDDLIHALGLNTTQDSQEGTYRVSLYDADTGEAVVSDMKITGHELYGIIHPNVDVGFDPMAGTAAQWNESENQYTMTSTGVYTANIHLADNGLTLQAGTFSVQFGNVSANTLGVDRVNVMTHEFAEKSLASIDEAIDSVVRQRTQIAAYSSAIERAVEDITASKDPITDTDYAKLTMRFVEFQILSRAENAVLTQANQKPEAIFSLMGNS